MEIAFLCKEKVAEASSRADGSQAQGPRGPQLEDLAHSSEQFGEKKGMCSVCGYCSVVPLREQWRILPRGFVGRAAFVGEQESVKMRNIADMSQLVNQGSACSLAPLLGHGVCASIRALIVGGDALYPQL